MSVPRVGDRLRTPCGFVWRVVCRGETFLTLLCGSGRPTDARLYVALREWPGLSRSFAAVPRACR